MTGWKSVFVNPNFTRRIVGVTKDESDLILGYLGRLITDNHDLQVRFKWQKNSVAIWDNRSVYHTATFDYGAEKRIGDRVVSLVNSVLSSFSPDLSLCILLQGEKPYFDPTSKSRREALGLDKVV